jgi:hypothetical protein
MNNQKYFKLQTNIPETVELLTACMGSYPNEKFGGVQYLYRVKHNGIEQAWYASEKQHQDLQLYTPGTILVVTKVEEGTKKWTKIVPEGDITVQPQNQGLNQPKVEKAIQNLKQEQVDAKMETQDRILRSMAFNNACTLLTGSDPKNVVGEVKILTKRLYEEMKDFINGIEPNLPF